jgi:quercetin dioxygenase-like cupin family protein
MKINSAIKVLCMVVVLSAPACKNNKNQEKMTTANEIHLFPKGDKLPASYFTGDAFLKPLLAKDDNNDFMMGSVTFEPGARTNWHTHPKGQVLIVTEGHGWYQVKGKPALAISKGDVINIPENTEHWHGASSKSQMVHIAITNYKGDVNVVWLKPVTDEEYTAVNK